MKPIVIIAFVLFPFIGMSQQSIIESNRKGLEILRKSLAAYGGVASTDSLKLSFKMNIDKMSIPGQSLAVQQPFEPYYSHSSYIIDRPNGIEIENNNLAIAGLEFPSTTFYQKGKGISCDPLLKQYAEVTGSSTSSSIPQLPQNSISAALRTPLGVRYTSDQVVGEKPVYYITCIVGSGMHHIYIDKATHLLIKQERLSSGATGEELQTFLYKDYQKINSITIPGQTDMIINNSIYGAITNTYTFSDLKTDFTIDSSQLKVPAGYKLQDYSYRKKNEIRPLAKNVYLLENITNTTGQWSYNVLFIVMDQYVVVAEAPVNSVYTERVINKIKEVAPGKPIKYLVQSHHHNDHIGGIRGYIAEGTTILTTSGNIDLINKMATVNYNSRPDKLSQNHKPATIETLKNKKYLLKDNNHEIEIYDLGPNPHSNELLIVYLPKERIIYQCDLINKGEYPLNETSFDFIRKIKSLNLKVDKIAGLHGQVLEKEEVDSLLKAVSK